MVRNITLGQYMPGKSLIHHMDARAKIVLLIVFIVFIFLCNEIFKELKGYFSYNTVYGNIESVLWNGGGIVAMGVFETDHRRYQ